MTAVDRAASPVTLDDWFVRDLGGLYQPWAAAPSPSPELVALNEDLAAELGVDAAALRTPEGVAVLAGAAVPTGATPVAMAYAGHQFGNYSPRLGDGRALLLGELTDTAGRQRDLHLKGSGRTPFARGGDGRATLGPMLREYVVGEAMHALGIPTTRALAVVTTGETVMRETPLPGAVLARVASSHLRVGTFQYAAATRDTDLLRRLTEHAIARHHPQAAEAERPALALLEAVVEAQAALVAQWMDVGFVHGVMNTDNMTISGETIDYGPCAFLDAYDPATVFSSIDRGGRYAFGNQPQAAQWNLARFAESLLTMISDDAEAAIPAATEVVSSFGERFTRHRSAGLHAKIGLIGEHTELVHDLVALLTEQRPDHTRFFRGLSAAARGDAAPVRDLVVDREAVDAWLARWRTALEEQDRPVAETADAMDRVNPVYIPRNHQVEAALDAAIAGDPEPFHRLVDVVSHPYEERPGLEEYAKGDPSATGYVTYCGT
ncbi:protein adenylyltransferase SelO [Actinomycetospora lemnae]|uniref:Protein nucleotidyltransferase YdiU n=1 Tax=Actinomycetospora lemnae TaxID=3019891 RepID=A0ABT5SMB5_9PSEU|nr:YdiU family protein [Actinomycetospora sp. DW7H6]MDD7963967.1 YdiU family protein [Actinomycetospora sp. DW7H6]